MKKCDVQIVYSKHFVFMLQLNRKIHITLSTEQEVINCAGILKLQNTAQTLTLY